MDKTKEMAWRELARRMQAGTLTEEEKARGVRNITIIREKLDKLVVLIGERYDDPILLKATRDFIDYIGEPSMEATQRFAAVCAAILWLEDNIDKLGEAHMATRLKQLEQRALAVKMAEPLSDTEMKH